MSLPEIDNVTALRWIHDGTSVALGTSQGLVQIWDAEANRRIRTISGEPGLRIPALAWNKHLLTTGNRAGQVGTHDVRIARSLVLTHQGAHRQEVCGLEWSPDGQQLASGSNDNCVHVWDVGQGQPKHAFVTEHRSAVKALAWCPWRPGILATGGGSQDRQLRTWDTRTGTCLSSLTLDSSISALVWSRTSRELVSAHGAPTNHVRVWRQTSTSASPCRLQPAGDIVEAHAGRILHMTLSPDGRTLVTAGADESIKFWAAFAEEPEAEASKMRKGKGLTTARRPGYILMPSLARSGAINKAVNAANQVF